MRADEINYLIGLITATKEWQKAKLETEKTRKQAVAVIKPINGKFNPDRSQGLKDEDN